MEKAFLYLVVFSILLHAAIFALIAYLPQERKIVRQDPYMVELQDLPPAREKPAREKKEAWRLDEQRRRVPREVAPPGESLRQKAPSTPVLRPVPVPRVPTIDPRSSRLPAERSAQPLKPAVNEKPVMKSR